jgi:hypothetical protein
MWAFLGRLVIAILVRVSVQGTGLEIVAQECTGMVVVCIDVSNVAGER